MSERLKELMQNWQLQKKIESEANALRAKTEIEIYKELATIKEVKQEGTTSHQIDDLKLTVTGNYTYKVDQEKASEFPDLFKVKYEHSKTMLKSMTDDQISKVEDCTTRVVAKPTFKVELKDGN